MLHERETTRRIREAVKNGTLTEPFRAADVNRELKIRYAGVFLPKHPRCYSEMLFVHAIPTLADASQPDSAAVHSS